MIQRHDKNIVKLKDSTIQSLCVGNNKDCLGINNYSNFISIY
jgi:hypothetical protein